VFVVYYNAVYISLDMMIGKYMEIIYFSIRVLFQLISFASI